MSTIILPAGAAGFANTRLARHVSLADFAAKDMCDGLWPLRDDYVTKDVATGRVTRVENLAKPDNPLYQAVTVDRGPLMVADAALNRNVADFDDDYDSVLQATDEVNYRDQFTLAVVFRAQIDAAKPYQSLIGRFGASAPERAYIGLTDAGNIVAGIGDGTPFPSIAYTDNTWAVAVMAYNGINTVSLSLNGSAWVTQTVTTEPVTTNLLQIGFNAAAGSTTKGLKDLCIVCNKSLASDASAADLADFWAMIRGYYGSVIEL